MYRLRSNTGPGVFAQMPTGAFLITRLVAVEDEWLLGGVSSILPASERDAAYRWAARPAEQHPALVYRNPAKLEQAWQLQHQERRSFIEFFGSDLIVVAGHEVAARLRAYHRFRLHEVRDAEGRSAAERARETYGVVPELAELAEVDSTIPPRRRGPFTSAAASAIRREPALRARYDAGNDWHVEAKGTTSDGTAVLLTPNEVRHAREQHPYMILFVLVEIELAWQGGVPEARGGVICLLEPWVIDSDDLTPVGYSSAVPRQAVRDAGR